MTTDQLAAIVAAAQEREGWKLHSHHHGSINHLHIIDGTLSVARFEERDNAAWTANAPRTILALVERIRELEAQVEGLEAQVEAQESSVDEHQVMTLAQLSRYTGFTVTALRSACYHGLIKHWKINNNQHYASTIAEVRRYKANKGKNRTNQHKN